MSSCILWAGILFWFAFVYPQMTLTHSSRLYLRMTFVMPTQFHNICTYDIYTYRFIVLIYFVSEFSLLHIYKFILPVERSHISFKGAYECRWCGSQHGRRDLQAEWGRSFHFNGRQWSGMHIIICKSIVHPQSNIIFFYFAFSFPQHGDYIINQLPATFQSTIARHASQATATCAVVFDKTGDAKLYLANMQIHKEITPDLVSRKSFNYHLISFLIIVNIAVLDFR